MTALRLGIDLGGTKIEAMVIDRAGQSIARRRINTPQGDYQASLVAIADLVASLENELGERLPVGIGTPGSLSPVTGRLRNSNSVCLNGKPLLEDLQTLLQREIRLANDADCFALSEASDGAGAGAYSVFGVIVGTGTGAGLVVEGKLIRGVNAIAGEWGHNPLPWPAADELPGASCYCGRQGCIETWLSGPALAREFSQLSGESQTAEVIARLDSEGVGPAVQALDAYVQRMARCLASVINLFDPEVIVLGGGVGNIQRLYEDVPRCWGEYIFSDRVSTRLLPPRHGDASGVRGAAWLWPLDGR